MLCCCRFFLFFEVTMISVLYLMTPHTQIPYIVGPSTRYKQAVRLGGRHNMPPPRDLDF